MKLAAYLTLDLAFLEEIAPSGQTNIFISVS